MKHDKPSFAALAAVVAGVMSIPAAAAAAELSSERTYMPDYCTNRDINCVVPNGAPPPARAGAAASTSGSATTGISGSSIDSGTATAGVSTVPAVPTFSGQVPSLPAQVPSTTSSAGAPEIAPNPTRNRALGRTGIGASGSAATGTSGSAGGGGAAAGGGGAARR